MTHPPSIPATAIIAANATTIDRLDRSDFTRPTDERLRNIISVPPLLFIQPAESDDSMAAGHITSVRARATKGPR